MFLRHLSGFRSFSRDISKGLERSSNTNLREKSRPKRGRFPNCDFVIVTLDPNKFAEKKQKRFHIGDLQSFTPYISLPNQSRPVLAQRMRYDQTRKTVTKSYPPDTRAFLYYSTSLEKPRIAGELRLRVASSDDPASFESGSDLLVINGQPWSRPLYSLSKYYSLLYEKLREDQLVPDDLDTALSTLPLMTPPYNRGHLLYTINDTFIVDFSRAALKFFVITERAVEKLPFHRPFSEHRMMYADIRPYTGSALARFERSTLPDHKGTRTVVLRFLKIITAVKCVLPHYDGHICCPKEGELFRRSSNAISRSVWNVNIDKSESVKTRGLRLLWDT